MNSRQRELINKIKTPTRSKSSTEPKGIPDYMKEPIEGQIELERPKLEPTFDIDAADVLGVINTNELPKPKRTAKKTENLVTPKLTEQQRRFAELVAHGVDSVDAYRTCYTVGENTKEKTVYNNARRTLNNVEVLKEIDRIKGILDSTQMIDHIPEDKRLEVLLNKMTGEEAVESEWNAKVAYKKLSSLLKDCEEAMTLLKERPKIFGEITQLMNEVRLNLQKDENEPLFEIMDNIQQLVYKVGAFDAKEYNSTINTANSIMKALNDITGITKNAKQIENEAFEKKLLTLITNMDVTVREKGPSYVPLKKQMEDYAFE